MKPRLRSLVAVLAAVPVVLAAACGGRRVRPAPPPAPSPGPAPDDATAGGVGAPGEPDAETVKLEPVRIEVVVNDDGTTSSTITDAITLFEDGNDALLMRRYDQAIAAYDRLVRDFPDSQLVLPAMYNAALAHEGKGDYTGAIERYRKVVARAPKGSADARDARFRMGALLAEVRQHGEAVKIWEAVLDGDDLSPSERIEALARLGYSLIEQKDYTGAEEVLRQALAYYHRIQGTEHLDSSFFVAMAQYYLAQIPHRQFRAAPLRYPEEQMLRDMEHKSELFYLARDRYAKVVDYKNPYWITAAVYQMGLINKEFWDDIMAVPMPPQLDEEGQKEYLRLLNENADIRKFLEGALLFHEKNIQWARQLGVDTEWVEGSRVRAEEARQILARQQKGELFEPGKVPRTVDEGGRPPATASASGSPAEYVPGRQDL